MRWFSQWPEAQARVVRGVLLVGWSLLILSLLIPALALPPSLVPGCESNAVDCVMHGQPGKRLFWGVIVPVILLIIVVGSHEFWRRICPWLCLPGCSFTRDPAQGANRVVLGVKLKISCLLFYHVQMQWTLLVTACLRLLVVGQSIALGC